MRQLPLYLKLQQLVDGELPEESYQEMTDLEREFRELDEIDQQKAEASDEDLELDEIEEDLMVASVDEETDLSGLIDRKNELEAQLFGDADAPWNDAGDEIQPLRELIENLAGTAGGRGFGGLARPRMERLLRAVDELDPGSKRGADGGGWRKPRTPGARNVVAVRRRELLAEFRSAWKDALSHGPAAGSAAAGAGGVSASTSPPGKVDEPDSTPSASPAEVSKPATGTEPPE